MTFYMQGIPFFISYMKSQFDNFMQLRCFINRKLDFIAYYSRNPHTVLLYHVISKCILYRIRKYSSNPSVNSSSSISHCCFLYAQRARFGYTSGFTHLRCQYRRLVTRAGLFLNKRERPFIKTYQMRSNDYSEMQKRHQIVKMKPILGYVLRLFSRRACSIFYCLRRIRLWILNSWISLHLLSCPPLSFLPTRIESVLSCTHNSMTVRAGYK